MRTLVLWLAASACAGPFVHKGRLVAYPDEVVADSGRPRRFALVVGVNEFLDSSWGRLRFAAQDASAMAEALTDFDEVVVLDEPGEVSRADVTRELDRLVKKAQLAQDVVLVYISAHGTLARTPGGALERYVVLEDADSKRISETALAIRDLLATLESSRSRRRAAVLAFCHSGEGKSGLGADLREEIATVKGSFFVNPIDQVSEATVVLSASSWGETAREDTALGHDVYTHFLLRGIGEGDRNGDGAVTITEAHDFARERTYYHSQGHQRPSAKVSITGVDPIVLGGQRNRPGHPELRGTHPTLTGLELWVDGQLKGSMPRTVAVEPGTRLVQVRGAGEEASAWVDLDADEVVEVTELLPPEVSVSVAAVGGAQALSGGGSALPAVVFGGGLSVGLSHWPMPRTFVELSVGVGGASHRLELVAADVETTLAHATATAGVRFELGPSVWRAGPSLGAVWLQRSFDTAGDLEEEHLLAPWAGASLLVDLTRLSPFRFGAVARVGYLPVRQDGSIRHVALTTVGLSLGYGR